MVYGHFPTPDCESPDPLAAFKIVDDRGGGGGMPWDSKLSMSSIAFCISESCSRRSGTRLSGVRLNRGYHLLVSFSSRDGNRSECVFI
jgi:hypothetical protein